MSLTYTPETRNLFDCKNIDKFGNGRKITQKNYSSFPQSLQNPHRWSLIIYAVRTNCLPEVHFETARTAQMTLRGQRDPSSPSLREASCCWFLCPFNACAWGHFLPPFLKPDRSRVSEVDFFDDGGREKL